jgi:HK97 family phage major capsid protein/HK97 family phage prohead protease
MLNRAYSILEVKSADVVNGKRIIKGIATTPNPDRVGDIVEPLGVTFKNPMPLLWQHEHDKPVGFAMFDKPTKAGITFTAEILDIQEAGILKDRLDEAWQSVKTGLVRAVSIGFRTLQKNILDSGAYHFLKSEVVELSLVTIPMQADATIDAVRSIDSVTRAASGRFTEKADENKPRVREKNSTPIKTKGIHMTKKTYAEQIVETKSLIEAKNDKLLSLIDAATETGETVDEAGQDEIATIESEVKSLEKHVAMLEKAHAISISQAKPVDATKSVEAASDNRAGLAPRISVKSNLPIGTAFVRYAMALARGKGNLMQSLEVSKAWSDTPQVETVLKAAVAAGTTTGATWAAPLVEYQVMSSEFAELLRPATIMGKITGMRNVPFNVKIPRQTAGSSVGWVGQGAPKPVSALALDNVTLGYSKAAGIVVLSDELVRLSNPSAEALVRTDLINSMTQFMDDQFLNPGVAAVANVSPASVSNGVAPVVASGTTVDALKADVRTLFANFMTANMSVGDAVWVTDEVTAMTIGMMQNALGQAEFAGVGPQGGTFMGLPMITSQNISTTAVVGPPAVGVGRRIFLVKASEILIADDGQTMLDVSSEASLQMDSAPVAGAQQLVSLWQNNLVALRAERWVNWGKRRTGAVGLISAAAYVA